MDNNLLLEKIIPFVDNMTLTQFKINQLKQRGQEYGEQCAELKRLHQKQKLNTTINP